MVSVIKTQVTLKTKTRREFLAMTLLATVALLAVAPARVWVTDRTSGLLSCGSHMLQSKNDEVEKVMLMPSLKTKPSLLSWDYLPFMILR